VQVWDLGTRCGWATLADVESGFLRAPLWCWDGWSGGLRAVPCYGGSTYTSATRPQQSANFAISLRWGRKTIRRSVPWLKSAFCPLRLPNQGCVAEVAHLILPRGNQARLEGRGVTHTSRLRPGSTCLAYYHNHPLGLFRTRDFWADIGRM
jgi:hypothetical protein